MKRSAPISMINVDSSNLKAIGYDEAKEQLYVRFVSKNRLYVYDDVPKSVYEKLLEANSKGSYFSSAIRGAFYYDQLS
jgi:hypothetical protein